MGLRLTVTTKHLYWIYHDAKARCTRKTHQAYHKYGARGIQFKFNSFEEWLNHIGPRPVGYEQDRIDNDGHYEVGNVRWTDLRTQALNKRTYRNNSSGIKGVTFSARDNLWYARYNNFKRKVTLYGGKDFFEACCARRSWELNQSSQQA